MLAFVLDEGASPLIRPQSFPRRERSWLLAHWDDPAPEGVRQRFETLVARRARGEPVAYLRGFKEFMGRRFLVDPRVLIPRPETELLVEAAADWLRTNTPEEGALLADVGTGSGAIAASLALVAQRARIYASDVSAEALEVARANLEALGVAARVTLLRGSLLEPLPEAADLVVANLPYLREDELEPGQGNSLDYEPRLALRGVGPEGSELIEDCLRQLPGRLRPGGAAMFEIGPAQAERLERLAQGVFPRARVRIEDDYAGRPRVLFVETGI